MIETPLNPGFRGRSKPFRCGFKSCLTLPMYFDFHIKAIGSYLALLGDIGNAYDDRLFQFLERQLQQFEIVFYVL
jgi:hypothetical protein